MIRLVIGLIKLVLIVALVSLAINWISEAISWISDNLWVFAVPLLPLGVFVATKAAGRGYGSTSKRRHSASKPELPKRPPHLLPYNGEQNKMRLYGQQRGRCKGCMGTAEYEEMEVDHSHPRSRWDSYPGIHVDEPANLQLLCQSCNRSKGKKTMEEFERDRRRKWI